MLHHRTLSPHHVLHAAHLAGGAEVGTAIAGLVAAVVAAAAVQQPEGIIEDLVVVKEAIVGRPSSIVALHAANVAQANLGVPGPWWEQKDLREAAENVDLLAEALLSHAVSGAGQLMAAEGLLVNLSFPLPLSFLACPPALP